MSSGPMSDGPIRNGLTPDEVQLVLRRALDIAHLPAAEADPTLSPESLFDIAAELDIPESALATAIAEQAVGLTDQPTGVVDRLVGPSVIWSQREATGNAEAKSQAAVAWLTRGHGLKTRVATDGTIVATRRRDAIGKLTNSVRGLRGRGGLARSRQVSAAVVGFDDASGVVCLAADIEQQRGAAIAGGTIIAIAGAIIASIIAAIAGALALIAIPFMVGAGLATSRAAHGRTVRNVTDALEETIDAIANEEPAPRLLGRSR
ncbi:MAG: hypothetical protein HKN26_10385 [Acidimicrobiales bacterium]|nr:hypothetical protein [Acidimicrobiales bacterium]